MDTEQLTFLARLPLFLTSGLSTQTVVSAAMKHLKGILKAEAVSVFVLSPEAKELTFWVLEGGEENRLEGMKMPAGRGIVGWAIDRQESVLVADAQSDPRFFKEVDKEGSFKTRDLLCVPLTVRGKDRIGAIQVLNKNNGVFNTADLIFLEQCGHQISLAIDNARLYEAVTERNKTLETLERRKNEMMTIISHEFRTPLNIIQLSTQVLAGGSISDEATRSKISQALLDGVARLTKLISDIRNLTLADFGGSGMAANAEPISVTSLINEVVTPFKAALETRKLKLELKVDPRATTVKGDFALVYILLRNLLSNAIRFTPDNGSIEISASRQSGFVEFAVKDTGIGIPKDQLSLIFQKFYEVASAMHHSSGDFEFKSCGLGLGLATARAIAKAHGSAIDVESVEGQGSTFRFRLEGQGVDS